MRNKITALIFCLLFLTAFSTAAVPSSNPPAFVAVTRRVERTVYITRTGAKYHRGDCRYLSRSKIPIKLSEARRQGYEPCKVCRP